MHSLRRDLPKILSRAASCCANPDALLTDCVVTNLGSGSAAGRQLGAARCAGPARFSCARASSVIARRAQGRDGGAGATAAGVKISLATVTILKLDYAHCSVTHYDSTVYVARLHDR
eukprot:4228268-Pleurochrysis_carterae.AAC.5